jgi:hypothetical protein
VTKARIPTAKPTTGDDVHHVVEELAQAVAKVVPARGVLRSARTDHTVSFSWA